MHTLIPTICFNAQTSRNIKRAVRSLCVGWFSLLVVISDIYHVGAQSKIPGAPSNAPARVKDATSRADDISDRIDNIVDNVNMFVNFYREKRITDRLGEYLDKIGASPTRPEVHLFYVQAFITEYGTVELKDFQYLTTGKNGEDAIRESFTVEHAPGTEDRMDPVPSGSRLIGLYVTATPEDGKFAIRGGSLSPDYYQKLRKEGMALRDSRGKERAEAQRIANIRQQRSAQHAATDPAAHAQLARDVARGPLPPGPALFPPGAPQDSAPRIYLPPTQNSSSPPADNSAVVTPVAHPPVLFDPPSTPPAPRSQPSDAPALGRPP